MIAFPNDIHAYINGISCRHITIIFNADISERMVSVLQKTQYRNFVHCPDAVPMAQQLCQCDLTSDSLIAYGLLHTILGMLLKEAPFKDRQIDLSAFDTAIRYISAHYTEPLSLTTLSSAVGVRNAHLSRLFSERVEGGFQHYLQILRVEKAKALLTTSDRTISEIMFESGFSDQRTFNRVFKCLTGKTPREYRSNPKKS